MSIDVIQIYSYVDLYVNLEVNQYKLHKGNVNTDVSKHFFTNRGINPWNAVYHSIVTALSGNSFKKKLRATLD